MSELAWSRRADRIMAQREAITDIQGQLSYRRSERSYFDVYEVQPDRSIDETYLLSGNEQSVAEQSSILIALNQLFQNRMSDSSPIDFSEWANQFEDGFSAALGKSTRLSQPGLPWGMSKDNRPRIVQLRSQDYHLVELFPDRDNLEDSYIFGGSNYRDIINQIMTFWGNYLLIKQYDFGTWLGYPIDQYLRQKPKSGIQLQILLTPHKEPPFSKKFLATDGTRFAIEARQVTVPFPKREVLTFNTLRQTCGGNTGLNWGEWLARAYIALEPNTTNIKGLSQLVACGPSKEGAERNLERFLSLTSGYVVSQSCTQTNLTKGTRAKDSRRDYLRNFNVYPGWCFIENTELINIDDTRFKGRPTLSGKMVSKANKLLLWPETEPMNWSATLLDLVKTPLS